MRIKSFSKINLTLRVLKKFKNGMHDIETNTVLINLFDEISIKKSTKDIIIFKGKFKNKINLKKIALLKRYNYLENSKF